MIGNIAAGLYGIGVVPVTSSYESIATVSVGSGGQSTISFTSISSSYKHLQIRYIARDTTGNENTIIRFNSDTGNNYATHYLLGNGSSASAGAASSNNFIYADILTYSATSYSAGVIDILDYGSSSKNKTVRTLAGIDLNGSGTVWLASGVWLNSSTAINSITLTLGSYAFAQNSHFALYGIKD
jgi:hypothetical protein